MMNSRTWLQLASVVAGAVIVGILAIAVPIELWTANSVFASIILFLSFALPPFFVAPVPQAPHTDAPFIWLIGPLGRLWFLLLVLAASAVGLSIAGWHRASLALCLGWLGICIIGFALLNASTQIVTAAASQTKPANINARSNWFTLLQKLQLRTDDNDVRKSLERFAEEIQFAANEPPSAEPGENREIDAILGQLESSLSRPDEVSRLLRSAEVLLAQREHSLRAGRTSA